MDPKPRFPFRRTRGLAAAGAPPYVLAIFDAGPAVADRYTIIFGRDLAVPPDSTQPYWSIRYLASSSDPTSPYGVSLWGEFREQVARGYMRCTTDKRIGWQDLPENVRTHVIFQTKE
jgi:hypothetical protein